MPESSAIDGKPLSWKKFSILALDSGILPGRRLNGIMIKALLFDVLAHDGNWCAYNAYIGMEDLIEAIAPLRQQGQDIALLLTGPLEPTNEPCLICVTFSVTIDA